MRSEPVRERFLAKIMPEPNCGCWYWTGSLHGKGYGHLRIGNKIEKAHRVAWILFKGKIPSGMQALHKCDTPECVNPEHLFLGTNADNMKDRQRKKRQARGESHSRALLTERDALYIRALYKENVRVVDIVKLYPHVSYGAVSAVCRRLSWRHI